MPMTMTEDTAKLKLKFLGMKWRFLRFDLEKETFPPLRPGPETQRNMDRQINLEQSVVLETFERGLNLSQSVSVPVPNEASITSVAGPICAESQMSIGGGIPNDSIMSVGPTVMQNESTVSMGPGCVMSEMDSVFTEEDVMMGIRNMQMFRAQDLLRVVPPSASRQTAAPTKTLAFSPRPPDSVRPSSVRISGCDSPRSPRRTAPGRRRKVIAPPTLQEQVLALDIGRDFKLYAMENGVRVPECVKAVDIKKAASMSPSRRKSSILNQAATSALEAMIAKRQSFGNCQADDGASKARLSLNSGVRKKSSDDNIRVPETVPYGNLT